MQIFEVEALKIDFLFFLILEEMHLLINKWGLILFISYCSHTILMSDHEEQQWIVVKPRKKKRIEKQIKPERVFAKGKAIFEKEEESTLEQEYLSSKTCKRNGQLSQKFLKKMTGRVKIHCLGLGNFASHLKPYLQLLFLKHTIIGVLQKLEIHPQVNIYDPIFSEAERKMIEDRGWKSYQFKQADQNVGYIFFLPHSERFLLEEVCLLRSEIKGKPWIVVGNSINDYIQRCQLIGQKVPESFLKIQTKDTRIQDYREAFNDTYIYEI